MDENEFTDRAVRILTEECSLTPEQAEALAKLTALLENN